MNYYINQKKVKIDVRLVQNHNEARYISELKDKGIIEQKGPDNGGKWKIK